MSDSRSSHKTARTGHFLPLTSDMSDGGCPTGGNRATRRALSSPARRLRDDLIRQWLEGTPRGRAVLAGLAVPMAGAIGMTRELIEAGHLVMTIGETRPDGTCPVRITPRTATLTGRTAP